MSEVVSDPDVPGLVRPVAKVVRTVTVRDWRFEALKDGGVFVSRWAGAPGEERMITHELLRPEDVALLTKVFAP